MVNTARPVADHTPVRMDRMVDPDPIKSGRVAQAMMKMQKIDIAGLRRAYDNG